MTGTGLDQPVLDHRERLTELLDALSTLAEPADAADVAELSRRLRDDRLRILVAGEAKRGKSTFVNALLGRAVLPTGVIPLTAIATVLGYGHQERVQVGYADGSTAVHPLDALPELVTEQGNPGNRRGVAKAEVSLDHPLLRGLEIVDPPGTGSVHEHNTDQARAELRRTDLAIFLTSADPPISASERTFLGDVRGSAVTTFYVLNKADYLATGDLDTACQFTAQVIAEAVGAPVRLYAMSARKALAARQASDDAGLAASGLPAFEADFSAHLAGRRSADLIASASGHARRLAAAIRESDQVLARSLDLDVRELAERVDSFRRRLAEVTALRQETRELLEAGVARLARETSEDAAQARDRAALRVGNALSAFLDEPAEHGRPLEDSGRELIASGVRRAVEAWRQHRQTELDAALRELTGRLTDRLDAEVRAVRAAAAAAFDVDLVELPGSVGLPESTRFWFDFGPGSGQTDLLAAAVRSRLPGRLGRERIAHHLVEAVPQLTDKQFGRARADFQDRLTEAGRGLRRSLDTAYQAGAGRVAAAVERASQLSQTSDEEHERIRRLLTQRARDLDRACTELDAIEAATRAEYAAPDGSPAKSRGH